ncbi:MAG: hypothetical protein IPG54_15110 [Sphingomonadales bacterium]|nr:hypothetical protein [Sphingomonadales bacterium]
MAFDERVLKSCPRRIKNSFMDLLSPQQTNASFLLNDRDGHSATSLRHRGSALHAGCTALGYSWPSRRCFIPVFHQIKQDLKYVYHHGPIETRRYPVSTEKVHEYLLDRDGNILLDRYEWFLYQHEFLIA